MHEGDGLVYYSPRLSLKDGQMLQAFTAIGQIVDEEVWQADEGDFKPWRRLVDYDGTALEVPIRQLQATLDLTNAPNWGYQLRRGLLELSDRDFQSIRAAMRPTA